MFFNRIITKVDPTFFGKSNVLNFTWNDCIKAFAHKDFYWTSNTNNDARIQALEKVFYYENDGFDVLSKSRTLTTQDPIHICIFIILYVGYIKTKINVILKEELKRTEYSGKYITLDPTFILTLPDLIVNQFSNVIQKPKDILGLCGIFGSHNGFIDDHDVAFVKLQHHSPLSLTNVSEETTERSYYVHAKVIDNSNISLTLNQVVHTKFLATSESVPLPVWNTSILKSDTHQSISRRLWNYLHSQNAIYTSLPQSTKPLNDTHEAFYLFKSNLLHFIYKIVIIYELT